MIRSVIRGIGAALPNRIVTNKDLEKEIDTSHEWIIQRTGIEQRYIADSEETTVSLGAKAAQAALNDANMTIADIDAIILATATPNQTFPASAVQIQDILSMRHGFAFDIQAVCSGFVFALANADVHLRSGAARRIIVIGSDTFSRILDWQDRRTCVLFGDGAGAVILEAVDDKIGDNPARDKQISGIINFSLRSDGQHMTKLYVDGGPSTTQTTGKLRMEGKEVFKHAVGMISDVIDECFAKAEITPKDLDWFVPHQANKRIIEASAKKVGIDLQKVVITVNQHGNTSAASVPLALDSLYRAGKLKKGDLVMLEAMGGGFTWGALLLRF